MSIGLNAISNKYFLKKREYVGCIEMVVEYVYTSLPITESLIQMHYENKLKLFIS